VNKYTVYTYTVCKGGGVWGSGPHTDKHLKQITFTGKFFSMTTFCNAFYDSYLSAAPVLTPVVGMLESLVEDPSCLENRGVIGTTAQGQLITCCAQV
jgi:hypothetical protein